MSIAVDLSSACDAPTEDSPALHLMPCEIEHCGEAKVSSFLEPGIRNESGGTCEVLTASFRGRPLKGQKIEVPSGYTGVILKEHRKPFSEDEDREVVITQKFTNFTHWNLDAAPSANDKCVKALQWMDIAKAIHSSVKEDEHQKSIEGK